MITKKTRLVAVLAIIISLPLSIAGAASQNVATGSIWGLVLAVGVDFLIDSFRKQTE